MTPPHPSLARAPATRSARQPGPPAARARRSAAGTLVLTAVSWSPHCPVRPRPGYAAADPSALHLAAGSPARAPEVARTEDVGLAALARDRADAAAAAAEQQRADGRRPRVPRRAPGPPCRPSCCRSTGRSPRRSAAAGAGCTPASTSAYRSAPRSGPPRTPSWSAVAYDRGGYGTHLTLQLADGTTAVYGHLSQVLVTAGPVTAGQVVALSGDTGHSTGPHLHFELRTGDVPFDPRPWLRRATGSRSRASPAARTAAAATCGRCPPEVDLGLRAVARARASPTRCRDRRRRG